MLAQTPELPADALVRAVLAGLPFARPVWQSLVGECLLYGSVDLPRVQTEPATLACLLAPALVWAAHRGSRELHLGGYYRPEHAGYNDRVDVARLCGELEAEEPAGWQAAALASLSELSIEDRAEELAHARDWWPALVDLYRCASREDCVVVCEEM